MADMDKSRHAFGMLENIDNAITNGLVDEYDILFVKDANGKPYVGWIDSQGQKIILEDKVQIVRVDELPVSDGDENVVYIFNNEGYVWNSADGQCVPMAKSADLSALEAKIDSKVDAVTVETMIETAVAEASGFEIVEF